MLCGNRAEKDGNPCHLLVNRNVVGESSIGSEKRSTIRSRGRVLETKKQLGVRKVS